MRKLALNDEILMKVEKPARYIGNEVNSVMKNKALHSFVISMRHYETVPTMPINLPIW